MGESFLEPRDQDLYVVADPEAKVADCHQGNNRGAWLRTLCVVLE